MVCEMPVRCELAKGGRDACKTCATCRAVLCRCERCGTEEVTVPGSTCLICGLPGGMREVE